MKQFIQAMIQENGYQATGLLEILRKIQYRYYCLLAKAIEQSAELFRIPRTQNISVIKYYSFFHRQLRVNMTF